MIHIVTDTTSSMTLEEFKQYGIHAVPLFVTRGEQSRPETFDLSYTEFYLQQRAGNRFGTSQPTPESYLKVFQPIIDAGDEIICVMISSGISGSYNTALLAKDLIGTDKISVFDSCQSGLNQAYLAIKAKKLAESGLNREMIMADLEQTRSRSRVFFIVESLRYLYEGGRLNGAQALIGSMIQIKPIIWFDPTGKMVAFEKIRTLRAAKQRVTDIYKDALDSSGIEHVGLHYGDNYDEAAEFAKQLEELTGIPVPLVRLSPVIATHTGPDILGLCYVTKTI